MQLISLSSGSSGNCYYLRHDDQALLIDLGISLRIFKKQAALYGLSLPAVRALLLTHDHVDHAKAAGAVSIDLALPVYTTELSHASIEANHYIRKKVPAQHKRIVTHGEAFSVGPFHITPIAVPHDSADNTGYFITVEGQPERILLLTDVGHFTPDMASFVEQATHLIVEANYDPAMLDFGPYPPYLKARIKSGLGHSSNGETGTYLSQHLSPAVEKIFLCHLSAENNRPELAVASVAQRLPADAPQPVALPRRTPFTLI